MHYSRLYEPDFDFAHQFTGADDIFYCRWAMFFEKMKNCQFGVAVESENELRERLETFGGEMPDHVQREVDNIVDVFAVNVDTQLGIRLSTQFNSSLMPPSEGEA